MGFDWGLYRGGGGEIYPPGLYDTRIMLVLRGLRFLSDLSRRFYAKDETNSMLKKRSLIYAWST